MNQVSRDLKTVSITGKFIGVYPDGQPFFLRLEGVLFLPIFSTPEKLQAAVALSGADAPIKTKQITDHVEFMESVKGVRLMLDPWLTERGTTRFTELLNDGTSAN